MRDAFEALRVEARRSEVTATEFDAGEGLFALRDLRRGSLVALYGGVRLPSGGWAEDDEFTGCRVRLNGQVGHKYKCVVTKITSPLCSTLFGYILKRIIFFLRWISTCLPHTQTL